MEQYQHPAVPLHLIKLLRKFPNGSEVDIFENKLIHQDCDFYNSLHFLKCIIREQTCLSRSMIQL